MDSTQAQSRLDEIGASAERARLELDQMIGRIEALRTVIAESPQPAPAPDPTPPTPTPEPTPPLIPEPMPPPDENPAPTPPQIPEPTPPPIPEPEPQPIPEPYPPGPELVPDLPAPEPPPVVAQAAAPGGDAAARLVAMKMAIDGTAREQIEAELVAKFGTAERGPLLDEVFTRAGR